MKYLALVFLFSLSSFSQTDSLAEALKYYPLQTGNYWEYEASSGDWWHPDEFVRWYYSFEVTGDTTLSNNKTYKVLLFKNLGITDPASYTYERIDSLAALVYRYSEDTLFINKEYLTISLTAKPDDGFKGSYGGTSSTPGEFYSRCITESSDSILGRYTDTKEFTDFSSIPGFNYRLAKSFGYIGSDFQEMGDVSGSAVVYAVIDGIEYGKKITSLEKGNYTEYKNYFLSQNYPNPFNPTTTISYQVPSSGLVTIKVYDILGKEITTLVNENKPAGKFEVKFSAKGGSASGGDSGNLSSGVYFYRLQAGSFIQTRKLLLLK